MGPDQKTGYLEAYDLGLIAYLLLYFEPAEINRTDPKRIVFLFYKTSETIGRAAEYWAGKGLVDPYKFNLQLKIIKGRIYGNA